MPDFCDSNYGEVSVLNHYLLCAELLLVLLKVTLLGRGKIMLCK